MPNTIDLLFDKEATDKLMAGVEKVARAVGQTLGPKGRNVILERPLMAPEVINDGVSIARRVVWLEDKFERQGALMILEAASKTNQVAGDGTTTSTILAAAIARQGFEAVKAGANPMQLRKGIELATATVVEKIKKMAKPVKTKEEIIQVGQISSESREVGEMIADIMDEVGRDGVIAVEEAPIEGMSKEIVKGLEINQGLISPYLMEDTKTLDTTLDNPLILVTSKKIYSIQELLPFIELVGNSGTNQMVIIAEDVDPTTLSVLIQNKLKGTIRPIVVKAPGFGENRKEYLEDIAALTGASVISEETGHDIKKVTRDQVGTARKVVSGRSTTRIIEGGGSKEAIAVRTATLKQRIQETASVHEKDRFQQRLAHLTGGIGLIKVGGFTEVEAKEKKLRIEDAIEATKAAIEGGIVTGGGKALYDIWDELVDGKMEDTDEDKGRRILIQSLRVPIHTVIENAGEDPSSVLGEMGKNEGYNVATDEYVDMFKAGIIDPAKVTISALQNAASVAAQLLTTGAAVIDKEGS